MQQENSGGRKDFWRAEGLSWAKHFLNADWADQADKTGSELFRVFRVLSAFRG